MNKNHFKNVVKKIVNMMKEHKKPEFQRSHNQNLDTMTILARQPRFADDIKEIRNAFSIDINQFKSSTDDMTIRCSTQWYSATSYEEEIFGSERIKAHNAFPLKYLVTAMVPFILKKYDLQDHYKNHILTYILTNIITAPSQNFSIEITRKPTNDVKISTVIHDHQTQADERMSSKFVKIIQEFSDQKATKRKRTRTKLGRDLNVRDIRSKNPETVYGAVEFMDQYQKDKSKKGKLKNAERRLTNSIKVGQHRLKKII